MTHEENSFTQQLRIHSAIVTAAVVACVRTPVCRDNVVRVGRAAAGAALGGAFWDGIKEAWGRIFAILFSKGTALYFMFHCIGAFLLLVFASTSNNSEWLHRLSLRFGFNSPAGQILSSMVIFLLGRFLFSILMFSVLKIFCAFFFGVRHEWH